MYLNDWSIFFIFILEDFIKGSTGLLNTGSHWVQRNEGVCPTTPPESFEMSLSQCIARCSLHSTCKALYYTFDTRQCRLQKYVVIMQNVNPLPSSPSTVYYQRASTHYGLDLNRKDYQTVWLDNNELMTFRIFFGENVTHPTSLQRCVDHGGKLIKPFTLARQQFFTKMSREMSSRGPYWIDVTNKYAANYSDINGWTTEDGQTIPLTNWYPGEPLVNLRCATMSAYDNNKWRSKGCREEDIRICEI